MKQSKRRLDKLEKSTGGTRFVCHKKKDGYFKDGRTYSQAEIDKIGETQEVIISEIVVSWRDPDEPRRDDPDTIYVEWDD